ncbi:cytochrome c-type biogenesis protein CcmH [Patulibacter sp. NPDC049589]|uniref:cytochrome c-type biogenesis protein n=1 Tax=Patulibacter sp. NPDC049589 TaxID=3154731 RepID=UPI00341D3549
MSGPDPTPAPDAATPPTAGSDAAAPGAPGGAPGTDAVSTPSAPGVVTVRPSWWARPAVLAVLLLLLLSFVSPVDAATPRTTLQAVEAELMCVTCKTPLTQSSAVQAERERAQIERLVASGATKQEAIDAMVQIYGNQVLIDPPEEGLRVARIALPVAAALFGAGLLFFLVRRWRRSAATEEDGGPSDDLDADPDLESTTPGMTADDRRRLDTDLERYA